MNMENLMLGQLLTPDKKQWVDVVADREGNQLASSLRKAWRAEFAGPTLDTNRWTLISQGAGQSISYLAGEITIDAGVNPDEEFIIRSNDSFTVPFRVWFIGRLSQRIINNEIRLEVVNAAGDHVAGWLLDGTTATKGAQYCSNAGNLRVTPNLTIATTASDLCLELELNPDEFWAMQRGVDSSASRTNNYCMTRNLPVPEQEYFVQVRVKNLSTPPASATTLTLGAIAVQDINELTAEITGGRGDTVGAKAIAVTMTNASLVIGPSASVGSGSFSSARVSAATTNATSVKTTPGVIAAIFASNTSASWRWLKLFNKTSAPNVGTDTPVATIGIPPGQSVAFSNAMPLKFTTGIAYAITANPADNDTTAIGAGDVVLSINYT